MIRALNITLTTCLLALLMLATPTNRLLAAGEASSSTGETISPGEIVILNDAFFPYVKLTSVSPGDIAHGFERIGMACSLMDTKTILAEKTLTSGPCRVLVNPFGNAFPKALIAPLREFHKRGGIFVSTGIPLTHPVVHERNGWRDEGHTDAYASASGDGLGIGTFAGTASRELQATDLAQRLGLGVLDWNNYPLAEDLQGLNIGSLDKQAIVEPILTAPDGVPFAAVIFQNAPGREDAIDIWSGTTHFNTFSDVGGLIHTEVIVRATAYALMKQGRLDEDRFEAVAAMKPNAMIFDNEIDVFEPHFISDRSKGLYPRAAKAPKGLILFDDRKETLSKPEQMLAASIQGLFNADESRDKKLMILWDKGDAKWAKWLESEQYVDSVESVGNLKDLMQKCPTRRAVIYDLSPSHLPNIALMVAACENALLVSDPELIERFGLQETIDLRGRWKTNTEAYQWVLDTYRDQISDRAVAIYDPVRSAVLRDYLIANKIFTFWVSGSGDGDLPGADRRAERALMAKMLSERFPVNIPCLGYPWAGEGIGIGEGPGVTMLSRAGKFLVPSDMISNLSVLSLFPQSNATLEPQTRELKLEDGKNYVSLVMSDGDNLCTWRDFFTGYWDDLGERDFPVGWTMGSSIVDLMPPIFDYVCKNLPQGDSIGGAVSGVGYVAMEEFGKNFGDQRDAVVKEFMDLTGQYCRRAGEKWLWIMRYGKPGSEDLRAYTDWTTGIDTFMGGYGKVTDSIDEAAEIMDGKAIFHAINNGDQVDGMIKQIDRLLSIAEGQNKQFFVHWFLFNWGMPPDDLRTLGDYIASKGIILVTPEELNSIYRQSLDQ